jgi:hypothetical protein
MTATDNREIAWAVARLQARVLALVGAILGGGGLFLATAWLVIKGGDRIGPHLSLLSQYFWGYSVTWHGALVGALYGAFVGGLAGWLIGAIYNLVAEARS